MAQVGVTYDTVTLVGAANWDEAAEVRDASAGVGPDVVALTRSASTRGAATATGAATQTFFIESNHGPSDWLLKRC